MKKIAASIGVVFIGSLLAGVGNYLYYPMTLMFISRENFSIFMSLLGIYNILGFITAGFSLYINKLICEHIENEDAIRTIFHNSLKIACVIGASLAFVMVLVSPLVAHFIQIDSPILIVYTALSIISALVLLVIEGYARGKKNFTLLSSSYMVGAFSKLGIGFLLLSLGFGVFGALLGCILGGYINALIGFIWASRSIVKQNKQKKQFSLFSRKKITIGKDLWKFTMLSIFISILMNIDIILARNIFNASQAGVYATISVIGKFGLFLLLSVESVFYSLIVEKQKNSFPLKLFLIPTTIILASIVAGVLYTHFVGEFTLNLLSKGVGKYNNILYLIVIFYGFLTLLSFFLKVSVAKNVAGLIPLMLISLLGLLVCVYSWGSSSLEMFALSFILVIIVSLVLSGALLWLNIFLGSKNNST